MTTDGRLLNWVSKPSTNGFDLYNVNHDGDLHATVGEMGFLGSHVAE
jgi:hypothetical protein